jgi:hypothetical protein
MTKERLPHNEQQTLWKKELRDLIFNDVISPQLTDIRVPRSINEIEGVTLAFSPKKSYLRRDPSANGRGARFKFGGVEGLFGNSRCVAVSVVEEGEESEAYETAKKTLRTVQYELPFDDHAEASIIRSQDIPLWKMFYEHVKKDALVQKVGPRVLTFSGLGRQNEETYNSQIHNFYGVLQENQAYLTKNGVTNFKPDPELGLDLAFYGQKDNLIAVPVSHIKIGRVEGGILVEKVINKRVLCPGIIIRQVWESKREAYERANKARQRFVEKYHDNSVVIAIDSAGQNSLWKKMGFAGEVCNTFQDAKISIENALRFLYLGSDNLNPGPLSRRGLSLPPANDFGVDILLANRAPGDMNFRYTQTDGVLGYFKKRFSSEFVIGKVDNVGGFVLVPDDWKDNPRIIEKIETSRRLLMRYAHHAKDINLVPVDRKLFKLWKQMGHPFVLTSEPGEDGLDEVEVVEKKALTKFGVKRINKNSKHTENAGTFLGILQQGPQIGGIQMMIAQRKNGDTAYNLIDMGGIYSYTPQAYQDLTAGPTTASGIKLELELQGLPMIPGIIYPEYILKTATGLDDLDHPGNAGPVASYIRSELTHRFTVAELNDVFGEKKAKGILKLGRIDESLWYKKSNHHLNSVTITHAHDDHDRGLFALDEARFIMRRQTLALLRAKTERAMTWRQQLLNLTLVQHKEGPRGFHRIPREVVPIDWNRQVVEISPDMLAQQFLVGHSLEGTGAPFFYSRNGSFKSVLYTADIRTDSTGRTQRMLNQVAGKPDVIVVDSTNEATSNKISAGITEEQAEMSLTRAVKANVKKPIVVLTPWHNLERMNTILRVAERTGRKVAFGYDHWEAVIQMAAEERISPETAEGFGLEYPRIGEDAALWARFATKPMGYQLTLQNSARIGRLGVLDNVQFREEANEWILVTAPSRLLMKDFNGGFWPNGVVVLHSAPFPYAWRQKWQAAANKKWAEEYAKGLYVSDFEVYGGGGRASPRVSRYGPLSPSGHGSYDENMNLIFNLLDGKYKGKQIVVVHGEKTDKYAKVLQRDIAKKLRLAKPDDLKVTGTLNTYNPKKPLQNKGHWIRLD